MSKTKNVYTIKKHLGPKGLTQERIPHITQIEKYKYRYNGREDLGRCQQIRIPRIIKEQNVKAIFAVGDTIKAIAVVDQSPKYDRKEHIAVKLKTITINNANILFVGE